MVVNEQVVSQPTEAQPLEQNPEMGQHIEQEVSLQDKGAIPYARFKEVIAQKNQLAERLSQLESRMQQAPTQAVQNEMNTVEDLLGMVQQMVDTKLNEAYETKLRPVESYMQNSQFSSNIERYFATPDKADVRAEMDAYTATLDPQSQAFLKQQIMAGNTRMLDAIYYQIKAEKGTQAQQQVQQQVQGMARHANQPQPFRTVRTGDPTISDIKQGALQSGNFRDFFNAIAPQ
jgi:hypothetical protein